MVNSPVSPPAQQYRTGQTNHTYMDIKRAVNVVKNSRTVVWLLSAMHVEACQICLHYTSQRSLVSQTVTSAFMSLCRHDCPVFLCLYWMSFFIQSSFFLLSNQAGALEDSCMLGVLWGHHQVPSWSLLWTIYHPTVFKKNIRALGAAA